MKIRCIGLLYFARQKNKVWSVYICESLARKIYHLLYPGRKYHHGSRTRRPERAYTKSRCRDTPAASWPPFPSDYRAESQGNGLLGKQRRVAVRPSVYCIIKKSISSWNRQLIGQVPQSILEINLGNIGEKKNVNLESIRIKIQSILGINLGNICEKKKKRYFRENSHPYSRVC